MSLRVDYYSVLGVARDCHADDIKKAFKQKAKLYHPDKLKSEKDNETKEKETTEEKEKQNDETSVLFSQIYTAYRTLSDPVLRDLYDSTVSSPANAEPKLTIEGDEMFKAFEYAQLYINNHFVSTEVLPKLALKYKHDFRFNAGNPCVGYECKLLNFTGMFIPMEGKPLIACVNHYYAHVCEDTCTNSTTQCPLYAECLAKDYVGKNMIQVEENHACSAKNCLFVELRDAVYVCQASGTPHLCTSAQCDYKRLVVKKGIHVITCEATGREFGEDVDPTLQQEYTKSKEDILEAFNLSSRNRKLKYKNSSGKEVEVVVDVPWGLNIGEEVEEVDEDEWKKLITHNAKKQPPPKRSNRREKRPRDDADAEDAAPAPRESFAEHVRKAVRVAQEGEEEEAEEGEEVYEHVEMGPYGMDGGANLDFREHDEAYDNLGDYETMRGQIGDEDDIVEEFKEDEEHEFDRDIALLDYRLEEVRHTTKLLEQSRNSNIKSVDNTKT